MHHVYEDQIPKPQARLKRMSGEQFNQLLENGSIICLGIAYPESAMDVIDARLPDGKVDETNGTSMPESTMSQQSVGFCCKENRGAF